MYQALYRKYRPQTFDDVVGQTAVTQTLRTQLKTGKISHAYLFTGTRGTGKTSCAKILAQSPQLHRPPGWKPLRPLRRLPRHRFGKLPGCAGDRRGIQQRRRPGARPPGRRGLHPLGGLPPGLYHRRGAHALHGGLQRPPQDHRGAAGASGVSSWPPRSFKKVPATILSRCQRFSFRRLLPEDIAGRLNYIAYQEHIDLDPGACRLLSRLADGALRDGVSLLDQCASAFEGTLTEERGLRRLGSRRGAEHGGAPHRRGRPRRQTCLGALLQPLRCGQGFVGHAGRATEPQPGSSDPQGRAGERHGHALGGGRRPGGQGTAGNALPPRSSFASPRSCRRRRRAFPRAPTAASTRSSASCASPSPPWMKTSKASLPG